MSAHADLLLFDVGAERFALPLDAVAAVLDAVEVRRGAGLHARAIGVLQTGDAFIPVFEPAHVLGVDASQDEPLLLLLANGADTVALLVDHAEAALAVPVDGLRDLSGLGSTDGVVVGALRPATRWVTLLDAESLITALFDRRPAHAV